MLADRLYGLTPDSSQRSPIWQPLQKTNSAVSSTIDCDIQNTAGQPYEVMTAAGAFTPGAAQYPTHWFLRLIDPGGAVFWPIGGGQLTLTSTTAGQVAGGDMPFLLMPQWTIRMRTVFNAGANANQTQFCITGFWIPRGTLSY